MTTPSDLIEEVARKMMNARRFDNREAPYTDEQWREFLEAAYTLPGSVAAQHMMEVNIAAAVIIEVCAKVAEDEAIHGDGELWIARKIAQDIRALAHAKPEGA